METFSLFHALIERLTSTLIFAATETTSSALSRALHLLALHQGVQHELRREIRNATSEGDLTYDKLMALPYLEAICKETLRLCVPGCVVVERFLIMADLQVSPVSVYNLNLRVEFLQELNEH
jgi:cytochrome P450